MEPTWTGSILATTLGIISKLTRLKTNFHPRNEQNKKDFTALVQEMSEAFKAQNLLFSVALSANILTAQKLYDVPAISEAVDWINIKYDYDYHETIIK